VVALHKLLMKNTNHEIVKTPKPKFLTLKLLSKFQPCKSFDTDIAFRLFKPKSTVTESILAYQSGAKFLVLETIKILHTEARADQ
jgi:hypothetical protein